MWRSSIIVPMGVVVLALAVFFVIACNLIGDRLRSLEAEVGRLNYMQSEIDQLYFYFWEDHEVRIDKLEGD